MMMTNQPKTLTHIKQVVAAHQIPDLTLLKTLNSERLRVHQQQINDLMAQQRTCVARGQSAASAMYQRHKHQADTKSTAFDMNAYEHTLQANKE